MDVTIVLSPRLVVGSSVMEAILKLSNRALGMSGLEKDADAPYDS